jgi:hypothetical protein
MRDPYVVSMSAIGVVVLAAAVWAIVADSETAFLVEVTVTLAMWVASTIRHAFGSRLHVVPR